MDDPGARAMYLFPTKALAEDQLHELQAAVDAMGSADSRLHLRRRHAAGRAPRDSRAGQRGADQSRHAAQRHSAASHQVGEMFREPALRRDRRAALLSRRVRQPSGERAAPAAAHLRILRIEAAVHLLLGDHRESEGTGRGADGIAVRAGGPQRRAERREILRVLQSAGGEPAARHPAQLFARDAAHRDGVHRAPPADAGVREQPAGDRNPADVSARRLRARSAAGRCGARISRRLSAARAARDRAQAARRRDSRRGGDQCAGAGRSTSDRWTRW